MDSSRSAGSTVSRLAGWIQSRAPRRRRTQLFCTGTAKSGTHSIEAIFKQTLRSAHEADSGEIIRFVLERAAGRAVDGDLKDYLLKRDRRLRLEIDSSQLNFFLLDELVELFPQAKFLLTIREPSSWLDSFINHQLGRPNVTEQWSKLRDFRFRPHFYSHPREEAALKERGLYTLDGYLSYWSLHNATVLEKVPADRLLVVRTDEIGVRTEELCEFAGVRRASANSEKSHAFRAAGKFNVLDFVPKEYLDSKIAGHCGDLIRQFFPEILSRLGKNSVAEAGQPHNA